ncbi:hypothetical protein BTO06_18185 [Tenacibaculum sp. SZ-18]|uniref:hybrid sensor histidine kinase/response regulator transcription factor n=1 Tax=Tenacibaculum sp. SZ-18 TaxID=754423 RepID=UPI000C2CFE0D|nr:hybrid sensor histidine kinase/response regulator transcription factor [Tenacibaculum sp. SZ-18]AUC16958.1 hypothetical protein BTO06_18185 [Tenacibaculum sp. SZ-18]
MSFKNIFYLLNIWFIIFSLSLAAQNISSFDVKHYTIESGLSNNWISDLYQDKDGFIWLGTQYGLNRFNGNQFKKFTYVPGDSTALQANWVRTITQLNNNLIYLGTLGAGINVLNPYTEIFSSLPVKYNEENIDLSSVFKITPDQKKLWISSATSAYTYDIELQKIEQISDNMTLNISIADDTTKLILSTQFDTPNDESTSPSKLLKVIEKKTTEIKLSHNESLLNLFAISKDSTLIYSENNLFISSIQNGKLQQTFLDFKTNFSSVFSDIPFIYRDTKGNFWINAGDSIYKYTSDFSSFEIVRLKNILKNAPSNIRINCMLEDNEGNYWFGTNLGVFHLIKHKQFRHPILQKVGQIREIAESKNHFWFALPDGIYKWRKKTVAKPKKINSNNVKSLYVASDNFLYTVGKNAKNNTSLLKINPNQNNIESVSLATINLQKDACWKIIEDRNQRLWISQWDKLVVYNPKKGTAFEIKVFKKNIGIIDIFKDNSDNLWLATISSGLLQISNLSKLNASSNFSFISHTHNPNNHNSISSNLIQSIEQDENGTIWIGTDGGLNKMDKKNNTFKRYIRNEYMPNDKILSVLSDKNGRLWLSTVSHGILSFDINSEKFESFMASDGLYNNSMLISSKLMDSNGNIWLGSEGGLQFFNPKNLISNTAKSRSIIWESLTKFRRDTNLVYKFPKQNKTYKNTLFIEPKDQSIRFKFQTISFENQQKIKYHFKLNGLHKNWLPPQDIGEITLSSIPKGNYNLEIKATYNDQLIGTYNPISITVIPSWYKTDIAYLIYTLLIGLSIFAFYKIQVKNKIAKTEKEFISNLSKAKTRWFNQIAHEFRTPLTIILGATDQIKSDQNHSQKSKTSKHLTQIENQTHHLSNQVQKILEIAQMQDNKLDVQLNQGDFIAFAKYLCNSFNSMAVEKGICINFKSSHAKKELLFDEDKWRKIISNLISNSIKYNRINGKIDVSVSVLEQSQNLEIKVRDNGIGMNEKFLSQLFNPFSKEKPLNKQGVGLGLTLTKELVNLLKGTIRVKSKKHKGTTISIIAPFELPKPKANFSNHDFVFDENDQRPIILIAEDNEEVMDYMNFCLSSKYNLLKAANGKIAWDLCKKHLPDLILSDIMMPELDGIELSKKIQENEVTNHIPLIFLTSKSSRESKLKGLKTGAEDYIIKPFNRETLILRIENIINSRKKLQKKYKNEEITSLSKNKKIDSFMSKAIQIIHKELDNDEFGVPDFAEKLNISRIHLFRKIKNLTGLPPNKFIRRIRLQKSKELLHNHKYTISEIAYQVGFKDPAYFTRVFKEEFKKSPSEFRKNYF